ncbi:filamentous hemagglutinin N-terminal domain-containing protein [Xanthobacter sp. V0B-10]|uniref:two-partner secretion domain-containing protein n=1 Tax=Xanthobacter albus TaxID=3119929 RepID=UPI00372C253F
MSSLGWPKARAVKLRTRQTRRAIPLPLAILRATRRIAPDGRTFRRALAATTAVAALLAFQKPAAAGPEGGRVISGAASISQSGTITSIDQSSAKAIINWQSFSVGQQETVNFNQPNASAVTLNRVIGNESSVIQGAINANGQVFLVNSNGILFTSTSQVNVGGLVASTLDISNEDFISGKYVFSGASTKSVVNRGALTAKDGGYISLMGKSVSNEGVITATLGTVALTAGSKITLNFEGNSLFDVSIDKGVMDALVENRQVIKADGGKVVMTARAADAVLSAQVNNSGIVQARTMAALTGGGAPGKGYSKGSIKLKAEGGSTKVSGKLDASAPEGGDGGFIDTSGDKVSIADTASILTAAQQGTGGTWLVDPVGFTVGAGGDVSGAFISNYLATQGSYEVQTTSGDIVINDPITWQKNTLTLTAAENILINSTLTATGEAHFVATWGEGTNAEGIYKGAPYGLYAVQGVQGTFAGKVNFSGNGTVKLQNELYSVINTVAAFNAIGDATDTSSDLARNYVLGSDIDFNSTLVTSIGLIQNFTGKFNGFGHVLSNPVVADATHASYGIFGTARSTISNIGVVDASLAVDTLTVGSTALLAGASYGAIVNSFVTGEIRAAQGGSNSEVGALVGYNYGLIANSYAVVDMDLSTTALAIGGLAGRNAASGSIVSSFSSGSLHSNVPKSTMTFSYGGLVGSNAGNIALSYSSVDVSTNGSGLVSAGGLIGTNTAGAVTNAYATGDVEGRSVGGFVGTHSGGTITLAYATGHVTGYNHVRETTSETTSETTTCATSSTYCAMAGGFVGTISRGTITDAYTTSMVATVATGGGTPTAKGFAGSGSSGWTRTYWTANNDLTDRRSTQLTSEQAKDIASYTEFSVQNWASSAEGHPILRQMPVTVAPIGPAKQYGDTYSPHDFIYTGLQWGDTAAAFTYAPNAGLLSPYGRLNAGVHEAGDVLASTSYSSIRGLIAVDPKAVAITGVVVEDKVYDGTLAANVTGGTLTPVEGEAVTVAFQSATFRSRNVGSDIPVDFNYTFTYGGTLTKNYVASGDAMARGAITPKTITATYSVADKVYDGTTGATVTGAMLSGVIAGDIVHVGSAAATFADRNAGSTIAVTVNGTLAGVDGGNYTLATGTGSANITPRPVRLIGSSAYDGNTSVAGSALAVANIIGGDQVVLTGALTIADAATGLQPITGLADLALVQDGGNYTLAGASGTVYVHGGQPSLFSGPQGGTVVSGTATITQTANLTNISQATDRAIINWQSFSVPATMVVNFDQPSPNSVTLNRVIGNEASIIDGAITANGKVFIVNSNGVLFTAGSIVNAGSLVASSLALSDNDFNAANLAFTSAGGTAGYVRNSGVIVAADGGYVALLGSEVETHGRIVAHGGDILLGAGTEITLDNEDAGLLSRNKPAILGGAVKVGGVLDVAADGAGGAVATAGGTVIVAPDVRILAEGAGGPMGEWSLIMPGDIVVGTTVRGTTLTATLAHANVTLSSTSGAITIDEAFGWSTNTLSLVTLRDINVNAVVDVTGNGSLVASYGRSRMVNRNNGNAFLTEAQFDIELYGLNMAYAVNPDGTNADSFAGRIDFNSTGTVMMGPLGELKSYTVINSAAELDAVRTAFTACYYADCSAYLIGGSYILGSDIDLSAIGDWMPIATYATDTVPTAIFSGNFNGFGHTISNLKSTHGGLFQIVDGFTEQHEIGAGGLWTGNLILPDRGVVSNVGVTDVNISVVDVAGSGVKNVGALIGQSFNSATLKNVFATGIMQATQAGRIDSCCSIGGLAGTLNGHVVNSYADVDVTATGYTSVGGFAGTMWANAQGSYATGNVVAGKYIVGTMVSAGGFAGYLSADIKDSYATGNVTGSDYVGGFVGTMVDARVYSSRATGSVHMLDGQLYEQAYGLDPYTSAREPTWSGAGAGGFAGINYGTIVNSSSSGKVTSESGRTELLGGFTGFTVFWLPAFSVMNAFNAETAGLSSDGRGNQIPTGGGHHGGGGGTPMLDAVNQAFGTNLTAAQFHGGAVGLSAADFATVTAQQRTSPVTAAQSLNNVMNGGRPVGYTPPTSGGGSGPDNGGGTGGADAGGGTGSGASGGNSDGGATGSAGGDSGGGAQANPGGNEGETGNAAPPQDNAAGAPGEALGGESSGGGAQPSAPTPNRRPSAAAQQAMRAATVSATSGVTSAQAGAPTSGAPGAGWSPALASIDDNIDLGAAPPAETTVPQNENERERRPASQRRPSAAAPAGYGASIRSIEVDGQKFDLERQGDPAPTSGSAAPATPAAPAH